MSLLVPARRPVREMLDDETLPADDMARSLRDLELVNTRWGGSGALSEHLLRGMRAVRGAARGAAAVDTPGSPFLVLDVGAGSGGVSKDIERRAEREGQRAVVIAMDLQWRHLAAGRVSNGTTRALAADALALPLADHSVDWVVSTLFFHHFSPAENQRLFLEIARVARRGFAILDLRRHLFPWIFVSLAGRLLFESRASRHDGPASVLQAYTPEEAERIARAAVSEARVERVFPFRMLITGPGR
jgi:SAM-dependent methyltransferase